MGIGTLEKMQAQITELQLKVERLEDEKRGITSGKTLVIERNPSRDEIVEMAKADVDKLEMFETNYIVNAGKRTVVALIPNILSGKIESKGIAKCSPDDCFNSHIGRAIALRRALGLEVPSEYINTPKPKDLGDVVWSVSKVRQRLQRNTRGGCR